MSKKCTNCQTELDDNVKFCPFCGAKVEADVPPPVITHQSSPADYMLLPKMRSSLLYGIVTFIISIVSSFTSLGWEEAVEGEEAALAALGGFTLISIIILIIFFVWIHQWCRNINRIAQSKIINPYVLDGILIGSAVINGALDCKFDLGNLLVFGGILFYLDKAYKMRKTDVSNSWQKALTYISIILIVDTVFSSWAELALADGKYGVVFFLYLIECYAFAFLIYFMQVIFNFAICSSEYQHKEYKTHWQQDFSAYHIFFKILVLSLLIIPICGLFISSVRKLGPWRSWKWLVVMPIIWLFSQDSDFGRPKWFEKLDKELQGVNYR